MSLYYNAVVLHTKLHYSIKAKTAYSCLGAKEVMDTHKSFSELLPQQRLAMSTGFIHRQIDNYRHGQKVLSLQ